MAVGVCGYEVRLCVGVFVGEFVGGCRGVGMAVWVVVGVWVWLCGLL